jgi:hypothetical protein
VKIWLNINTRNNLKEWLKNKISQIIFWGLFFNLKKYYKLLFFHVYLLHAKIYFLKFSLELKKVGIATNFYS